MSWITPEELITFVILAGILYLFFRLSMSRMRLKQKEGPAKSLVFDWALMPLDEANDTFRERFQNLDRLPADPDIQLVRFGLFNVGRLTLLPDDYEAPLTVTFTGGAEILDANFSEAIRSKDQPTDPIDIAGDHLTVPPFRLEAGGTAMFTAILRGGDGRVQGAFELRQDE